MSHEATGRGSYAKTPARRAQILRAALAAFAEHGYERASLRDIAARAGISHTGLLHHFTSKDELLTAALRQQEVEDRVRSDQATSEGASGIAVLADAVRHALEQPDLVRSWAALRLAASDPG